MESLTTLLTNLQDLDAQALRRQRRCTETGCATHMQVDGRTMVNFASNDYLGLASHPKLIAAFVEGAARYGVGSGGSHLLGGHSRAHAALEDELAAFAGGFIDRPRALYFCTGYMANLATLSALASPTKNLPEPTATIFSDALNHASLIDGARLSRANVQIYPHVDTSALETLLSACKTPLKLIVTDALFSMDGDIAPLDQLLALAEKYHAWLVVDDAHGFGVLGSNGAGTVSAFGLRSPRLVYVATLGKAAGVAGAFVIAHDTVIEWLIQRARPYIFTTASPPAVAHAASTSLTLIASSEGQTRRRQLQQRITQTRTLLQNTDWQSIDSITAIQPLIIGENAPTLTLAAQLDAKGLWVPAIRPPTVAPGASRLRISLSANHSPADLEQLSAALLTPEI
ncbi:8-amino-7-oxononanoate synthase [Mycoavidus sp. SF9855]|uniref:8-amino-7-oxononanoate synthase n=1 Tax=Mycoavidus sp. SF9855 TaxID=2968475 RepID=UPI00211C30CD|nr:8-amino-7-oxononanoate synthase [Mycoavidus sp. SF9855]UUM21603.1 8-amino-7-oxononanoate synthase [Mycoavidus sp. SF9855]